MLGWLENLGFGGSAREPFGQLDLVVIGCGIPIDPPVARPALFVIPSTVIEIFEREIDGLITDLGRDIKLIYDPSVVVCINCQFDPIGNKSNNRFRPGGPISFPDGSRCPYCNGSGRTEEENSEIIKALVSWDAKDYIDFGISIQNPNAVVRTKTLLKLVPKIQRAKEAIVDYRINDILKLKCRKLRDPIPTGLKNSRYAITWWQRT